jgi:hypothetical protein
MGTDKKKFFEFMNNIMTQRDKKNNQQPSTSLDGGRAIIFTKKINTHYKLVPFNIVENHVGKTKYLPAVSKE